MGFLPGGRLAMWYYFLWGSSTMGFLPGKVCHMIFLHGERLPHGIVSAGTISHGICSLIMKFVCGGGGEQIYHRGETLPYGIVPPPGEVLPWDFFRGKVCHMVFLQGDVCHMV